MFMQYSCTNAALPVKGGDMKDIVGKRDEIGFVVLHGERLDSNYFIFFLFHAMFLFVRSLLFVLSSTSLVAIYISLVRFCGHATGA